MSEAAQTFPSNPDVPNAYGVTRTQAEADAMICFGDMAKALNNIGVQLAGPSSNPGSAAEIAKVRAIFEKWNITEQRMRTAFSILTQRVAP